MGLILWYNYGNGMVEKRALFVCLHRAAVLGAFAIDHAGRSKPQDSGFMCLPGMEVNRV